jgi:hypothetical protein
MSSESRQAMPRTPGSQYRGTAILVGLAILLPIAIGIAALIPVTMCPALENEWTESILWTQVDPKMDDYFLEQLRGKHKFCKLCGGTEKVPVLKKILYRSDSSEKPRWVIVASITIASDEDFNESENTCIRIKAILSKAGIPYQVPPGGHGTGVFVPEQFGENAIRLISGDQQARKNQNLTVITNLRKGPHR